MNVVDQPALRCGVILIDPARHEVSLDGEWVQLAAAEMRILYVLAANRGRVYSHERLRAVGYGEDSWVTVEAVRLSVKRLRGKLGDHRGLIETVRGEGYRWTARSVSVPRQPDPPPPAPPAAVLPAPPPPVERHLLPTGVLVEVVVDVARVLAARPVDDADDWAALERLRNHPAVRALLSPPAVPREPGGGA